MKYRITILLIAALTFVTGLIISFGDSRDLHAANDAINSGE